MPATHKQKSLER